ncbi:Rieske (2Fe-2S) protein [Alkalihalobacillus sp. BA299]|uniref:Rieske (2Fe-2S) protein n=1 Tax=Alkalihalobacillus sp. BA299 TaxID=2815938 RepID=UPI001ADB8F38|nr:Rieske (2Fe-2S) protein [Alkalihalobacillus sp. BA299]
MTKYTACKAEEIKNGDMKAFTFNKKSIVVVRSKNGELYALRNVCPHKGPALSLGSVDATCTATEPGEYTLEKEGEVLKCPWHSWEFDIKTGCSLFDPENVKVKTYDVTVEDDTIFVHM